MPSPIDKTLQLLGKSKNKAAARLLESALSSSNELVRQAASHELVFNRGIRGLAELIERTDRPDEVVLALFDQHRGKMIAALRSAVVSTNERHNLNAFRIILHQRYYEILPTLLTIFIERGDDWDTDSPLAEVIDSLSIQYVQALDHGRQRRFLRDGVLGDIMRVLTPALLGFHRNDPLLIPTLFLRLYPFFSEKQRDVTKILRNPALPVYMAIHKLLQSEDIQTVYRFVFHCLGNPDPPPLAQTTFSKRIDVPFLEKMFEAVGETMPRDFADNLKRSQYFEWFDKLRVILDQLENASQKGLVDVIKHVNMPLEGKLSQLIDILQYGKPAGRLASLNLLATFSGERIDQQIWQSCDDVDPNVQSAALVHLRRRELPKAALRIIQCADSPHAIVRETVQSLLPEFRFDRFLATFDQMSVEQRSMTFNLIKKIDQNLIEAIRHELQFGEPVQQAKSLLCIEYGDMVVTLEEELCTLLMRSETPALRVKASQLLAAGRRELSRGTLVQAFHRDISPDVRAAAKESLENRPTPWEIK